MEIEPSEIVPSPATVMASDVLPEPDSPTTPTTSPRPTVNDTRSTATTVSARFWRLLWTTLSSRTSRAGATEAASWDIEEFNSIPSGLTADPHRQSLDSGLPV